LLVEAEVTCSDDEVLGVADGQALVFLWQPETTAVINSSDKVAKNLDFILFSFLGFYANDYKPKVF
jgi:hypothetical protein